MRRALLRVRARSATVGAVSAPLAPPRLAPRLRAPGLAAFSSTPAPDLPPLFVKTEETPNPRSLKFVVPGRSVLDTQKYGLSAEFKDISESRNVSPLASALLQENGVVSVFLGSDFVTVTREQDVQWGSIRGPVTATIMSLFSDDAFEAVTRDPREAKAEADQATAVTDEEDEVVELIMELLEQRIRPMVMEDGGDIHFRSWNPASGVVTVQLSGSCVGCPSSLVTLKHGVEQMLKHYIPEVNSVEEMPDDSDKDDRAMSWKTMD